MPAAPLITTADLAPFATIDEAKAQAMIDDAVAMAALPAPCILEEDFAHGAAVKAILRGVVLRWNETGVGAARTQVSQNIGPFGHSEAYQQPTRRALLWPSEIDQLKKLCADASSARAWSYDTVTTTLTHSDVCDLNFGGDFCSCGAILTGAGPLWENVDY